MKSEKNSNKEKDFTKGTRELASLKILKQIENYKSKENKMLQHQQHPSSNQKWHKFVETSAICILIYYIIYKMR